MARTGNIQWTKIPRSACVVDTGKSFVAVIGKRRYLINWSSFDARQAQTHLRERAKRACSAR